MGVAILKVLISFIVVCGLILLSSKIMQHSLQLPHHRTKMKVLDQIKVSPKTTLSVVQIGGECFLIGSSDQQCVLIKELNPKLYQEMEEKTESIQPLTIFEGLMTFWKRRSDKDEKK